jgi:hypothetical protein
MTGENTLTAVIAYTEQTTVHSDLFEVNAEFIITDGSYTTIVQGTFFYIIRRIKINL